MLIKYSSGSGFNHSFLTPSKDFLDLHSEGILSNFLLKCEPPARGASLLSISFLSPVSFDIYMASFSVLNAVRNRFNVKPASFLVKSSVSSVDASCVSIVFSSFSSLFDSSFRSSLDG